jgi:hypothetical protein
MLFTESIVSAIAFASAQMKSVDINGSNSADPTNFIDILVSSCLSASVNTWRDPKTYRPDLPLSDFFLFRYLKSKPKGLLWGTGLSSF